MVSGKVTVLNQVGIHLRPAERFCTKALEFSSKITICKGPLPSIFYCLKEQNFYEILIESFISSERTSDVTLEGKQDGYTYERGSSQKAYEVMVQGIQKDLNKLSVQKLNPHIDVERLTKGSLMLVLHLFHHILISFLPHTLHKHLIH